MFNNYQQWNYQQWADHWANLAKDGGMNFNNHFNPAQMQTYMQNMFGNMSNNWFENVKHFSNPTELFSAIKNFQNFNLENFRLDQIALPPFLEDLRLAVVKNDVDKQREILHNISNYWCEKANFAFLKNVDVLMWQKGMFEMMLSRPEQQHFEDENVREIRIYILKLIGLYDSFVQFIKTFEGFDESLATKFIDKVVDKDVNIEDITNLFNIWTSTFESFYRDYSFSDNYQESLTMLIESSADVKQVLQKIIDRNVEKFGLPSNREMDTVHFKLHSVAKSVRNLEKQLNAKTITDLIDKKTSGLQSGISSIEGNLETIINKLNKSSEEKDKKILDLEKKLNLTQQELKALTKALSVKQAKEKRSLGKSIDKSSISKAKPKG